MHMPAACGLKHHANQEVQTARNAHGNREGENHASKILRMVDHCKPDLLATAVPATALDKICVVDTGKPNKLAPISFKVGYNKGQKWYGPNRSRRC